jgi:uncharacterized membrane protein YgdD (TMEM256/DUF423 family)
MDRLFAILGAGSAFISVLAGAFGAHALRGRLSPDALATFETAAISPDALATFETAARYEMYHALALLGVAWAVTRWPGPLTRWAGWLFVIGTVLFTGSLYSRFWWGGSASASRRYGRGRRRRYDEWGATS